MENKKDNRKTIIIIAVIAALILAGVLLFVLVLNKATVTFNSNGGSPVASVKVKKGEPVIMPVDPEREDYGFVKWTLNGEDYNFAKPVTEDITLEAQWYEKIQVIFKVNGEVYAKCECRDGLFAFLPDDPKIEGYTFVGWFDGDNEYQCGSPVEKTITVDARLYKIYKATFMVDDSEYAVLDAVENWIVPLPENPEKKDYKFIGWEKDGQLLPSDYITHSDLLLKASFRKYVPVDSIYFETEAYDVEIGKTIQLRLEVHPDNWAENLSYYSKDTSIATIDENGRVTGIKGGQTDVFVVTESGKKAGATICVIEKETGIKAKDSISVDVGKSANVGVTFTPSTATTRFVTYKSTNPAVATVDEDGNVTGKQVGHCTIISTSEHGFTAQTTVYVNGYHDLYLTINGKESGSTHYFYCNKAGNSLFRADYPITVKINNYQNGTDKTVDLKVEDKSLTNHLKLVAENSTVKNKKYLATDGSTCYATSQADEITDQLETLFYFEYTVNGVTYKSDYFKAIIEKPLKVSCSTANCTLSSDMQTLYASSSVTQFILVVNQEVKSSDVNSCSIVGKEYKNGKYFITVSVSVGSSKNDGVELYTTGGQHIGIVVKAK